ncbi:hypothetical protein L3V59_24015 [Burkholderia aenigmatica]|uniref:hypothetical protein n=1 Tax=Burkholderia aenigmatica TaxID=2015348 RepID=UPI001F490A7F|nr:hypothetical protein [Burkholderia aenigmatica]UKD15995.1 hypothetical protein L3V59_24015 [Burkholderia aenigmatica]
MGIDTAGIASIYRDCTTFPEWRAYERPEMIFLLEMEAANAGRVKKEKNSAKATSMIFCIVPPRQPIRYRGQALIHLRTGHADFRPFPSPDDRPVATIALDERVRRVARARKYAHTF